MPLVSFIPEQFEEGFKQIAAIDEGTYSDIQTGLSYSSLVSSLEVLIKKISEMKHVERDILEEIFSSIGSLIPLLENVEMINEIVEDLVNLSLEGGIIEIERKETFKTRLLFLLNNEQIYYASKAQSLVRENENIYIDSRVITDLRPVFGINLDDAPKGGIVIHNLHIHYKADQESDHKDIYLSLDSSDIKALKESLIRAEKKENNLQSIFIKSGMTNLNE